MLLFIVGLCLYGRSVARARVPSSKSQSKSQTGQKSRNTNRRTQTDDSPSPEQKIEVRRSARRHRTVSAYRKDDVLVVLIPAAMTKAEEEHWVAEMERKLQRQEARRASRTPSSDEALWERCAELSRRYLDGSAQPASVRWVPPMRTRWASCTPSEGTIRVSERLRNVPEWVLDYVLVHELAHLRIAEHNTRFWELVRRYPKTERAIGYLEGLSDAEGLDISGLDEVG